MISPRRATRKVGRAVHWQPVDDAFFRLAEMLRTSREAAPIYVAQHVLINVEARCRASDSAIVYGLLIGERCSEPITDREYVLIDGTLDAPAYVSAGDAGEDVAATLQSLAAEAVQRGKVPIGWYRSSRAGASAMAREGVALHRSIFGEPWQVMLAIEEGGRGRFVRVEPADGRAYSTPFFELLPDRARTHGEKLGTAVNWENYQTPDFVVPLEKPTPTPNGTTTTRPESSRRPGFVERFTSLRGMLVRAPQPSTQLAERRTAGVVDKGTTPPRPSPRSNSPTVASSVTARAVAQVRSPTPPAVAAPTQTTRRPVTFPMLVPPRAPWDRGRSRTAVQWGAATIVVGLIIAIAILTYRLTQ